jgi:hypothetical protein
MNDAHEMIAKLELEKVLLKSRLRAITKALVGLRGLAGSKTQGIVGRPQKHSARSRAAISKAKKKWWADRKKSAKV